MLLNKKILLISPEPWGENHVSKHHYANYLSKNNHVYFLNPATGFKKNPFSKFNARIHTLRPNLTIVSYTNLLPKLNLLSEKNQKKIYAKQSKLIQNAIDVPEFDIVWSFDPYRYFDQSNWEAKKRIYHSVDFHPSAKFEKLIIDSSDYYFGIADLIIDSVQTTKAATNIGHGADIDGFSKKTNVKLPGTNEVKAIYIGNFHRHIDYNLLEELSTENKDVDFIMIGPTKASNLSGNNPPNLNIVDRFKGSKNIHFLGSVSPEKLMSYMREANINLVIFKKSDADIHCNPHKLMGYFYSGNVTVSSFIHAYKNASNELIRMVSSEENFIDVFKEVKSNLSLYNRSELRSLRTNFAIKNSYENKLIEIAKILDSSP